MGVSIPLPRWKWRRPRLDDGLLTLLTNRAAVFAFIHPSHDRTATLGPQATQCIDYTVLSFPSVDPVGTAPTSCPTLIIAYYVRVPVRLGPVTLHYYRVSHTTPTSKTLEVRGDSSKRVLIYVSPHPATISSSLVGRLHQAALANVLPFIGFWRCLRGRHLGTLRLPPYVNRS